MNPHKVMEHPACGRVLDTFAFLVWKCGLVLFKGGANPVLQGGIDQQANGHHHQQRHDASQHLLGGAGLHPGHQQDDDETVAHAQQEQQHDIDPGGRNGPEGSEHHPIPGE